MHRSRQAHTAQQRQASPLQQTQATGAETHRIFQVIGNAQGQGTCEEHSKKQGAWAGQRHGVSVTIKGPVATVVESAQALQGGQMQTFQQIHTEIPTDIRGSDVGVCRTLLTPHCEGKIPTGPGNGSPPRAILHPAINREPTPAAVPPASAHRAGPGLPGTIDCCARCLPSVPAGVPVRRRLPGCAGLAGCFPDSPGPCPTGCFANTGDPASATGLDRSDGL
ncbi:hypothetical protein D3C76_1234800 [compost metagenome]